MKMFNIMAKALGMKAGEDLGAHFEGGKQSMRMNYYPKCPQPGVVMGLNPHSDGAGLTILLQLNEVEGLQIKKDGAWIPITPLPNAFVVNIADMLEILTNGIYKSVEHRPVFNPNKERLSVATFFEPRSDVNLSPAESLITPQNPQKFKHIGTVADYAKGFFSRQLGQRSYLDTMRIVTMDQENN
nr:PREDICTED: thebaine 6-O-demethylase-like [Nicotiana sylvestris]